MTAIVTALICFCLCNIDLSCVLGSSAACPVDVAVVSSDDDLQIELEPLAARLQVHGPQTNSPPNLLFHTTMCDVNSSQQQTTQMTGNMQTR